MRTPLSLLRLTTAIAILVLPAIAWATPQIGEKSNGWNLIEERGLRTYEACWSEFKAQCGRNIVDDGLSTGEAPSDKRIREWTATMDRWLNPPEPTPIDASSVSTESTPASSTVAPTTAGGCPASMAPESGSAGYSAYNPSSGATGCYQVIPSTASAYGCDLSTPAGQDECAARICEGQGAGAWAASGANPC